MSIRHKRRGLLAMLYPRAALTCIVTAILLAVTVQSASAFVPCPTGGNDAGSISDWDTKWPIGSADPLGVTMCLGEEGIWGTDKGWLQIVDLGDGAKIRLIADREPTGPESSAYEPDVLFRKRTADAWYTWLRSLIPEEGENWAYTQPDNERLFSVTNASFFKDADNDNDTMVPFPRWTWGVADTYGVAERLKDEEEGAFDWNASKRYLAIGYPYEGGWEEEEPDQQTVRVGYFPTRYEEEDLLTYIQHVGGDPYNNDTIDATVGFSPEVRTGASFRRNYLGVHGDVVYMFTSDARYTNQEAIEIMQEIRPGMTVIQLDGGASTQMHSLYGDMDSDEGSEVPDVLAIYRAPYQEEE